jgi:outer membrane beta-barrel protein
VGDSTFGLKREVFWMKRLLGALAFVGATVAAATAGAQEIQIRGPLANASACRRCVQYRTGRFSITPTYGITLQDPFDRAMWFGANLQYHFNDIIAVGVWGGYAGVHIPTSLTEQISNQLGTMSTNNPNVPVGSEFRHQIGQLNWMVTPQLVLIPLRGKLALFQNIFIDTDFYIHGGLAIVGVTERANFDSDMAYPGMRVTGNEPELVMNQTARSSRVALAPSFGVGVNFYINHFLSLSIEYRAYPFSWNTSGTDESSTLAACGRNGMQTCSGFPDYQVSSTGRFVIDSNDQTFVFNQMVTFGLNIFLPTAPHIGD